MVYAAQSPSLAALEVLVHFDVLPRDFVLTPIAIPDSIGVLRLEREELPPGWNRTRPLAATQRLGESWVREGHHAVLCVPSSIVAVERNFVFNVQHPDFPLIRFLASAPFRFDSRLRRTRN